MGEHLAAHNAYVSYENWVPAPPAYDARASGRTRPLLGAIALGIMIAGPGLMILGLVVSIALGYLFPAPVYLAAVATLLAVPVGLVVAAVAMCRNSGRWRGLAAIVAAAPVTALALQFAVPLLELLRTA